MRYTSEQTRNTSLKHHRLERKIKKDDFPAGLQLDSEFALISKNSLLIDAEFDFIWTTGLQHWHATTQEGNGRAGPTLFIPRDSVMSMHNTWQCRHHKDNKP